MPERTSCEADTTTSNAERGCSSSAVFAQAPEDVLDIDHGVIDQFADGDGEPPSVMVLMDSPAK